MSNKKLKEKKKKAKELKSRKTVLARRTAIRLKAKQDRELGRLERATRVRLTPLAGDDKFRINELYHNLDILKALEEEYLREQLAREEVNVQLEAEGYLTLDQKKNALLKKADEATQLALQDVYIKEQLALEEVNNRLEAAGALTAEEKENFLINELKEKFSSNTVKES